MEGRATFSVKLISGLDQDLCYPLLFLSDAPLFSAVFLSACKSQTEFGHAVLFKYKNKVKY